MSDDSSLTKYSDLLATEKLLTKEYIKSILRAKAIALISETSAQLKDIPIDDNLVRLTNEIFSYEEQFSSENSFLEEVLKPLEGILENKVLDCVGCLLKTRDKSKCPVCNDVLRRPYEDS